MEMLDCPLSRQGAYALPQFGLDVPNHIGIRLERSREPSSPRRWYSAASE